jgi:Ricin-type beta-trefoil lectin domain
VFASRDHFLVPFDGVSFADVGECGGDKHACSDHKIFRSEVRLPVTIGEWRSLVNSGSGKCLAGDPMLDSAQAFQTTCDDSFANQKWRFEHVGDGAYFLRNFSSDRCLTIRSFTPGAPVITQACINVDAQQHWFPQATGNGDMWLMNRESFACIRVRGTGNGGLAIQDACNDAPDDRWR